MSKDKIIDRPKEPPKVGIVSLGCPKALVDSERILTRLRAEGYDLSPTYDGADVVIVNTCGFLDSAKAESLDAIGEAMAANGKVIVTGCMGIDEKAIRDVHPDVLSVSGPQAYDTVMDAIHRAVEPPHAPFTDLIPPEGLRLTPRHYAYLKISEGRNHHCSFCIIPSIRGDLVSRPITEVLAEAEDLADAGVKELLVIAQDTAAYGLDRKHESALWYGKPVKTRMTELADALGDLGIWVRLHYVYPYPHVTELMPLMAEGKILPYLDVPFQHASPRILKAMKRPASDAKALDRIREWRAICPDLAIRSTFIVGFPGETEEDFQYLLDWMDEAQLDRVGCFKYEAVAGAAANALPGALPEEIKQERWERFMEAQQDISAAKLAGRVGTAMDVLIDEVDSEGAIGRTYADAPEIDGAVYLDGVMDVEPGDMIRAFIEDADAYDLWATPIANED